jgi:hypothetical protein
MKYLFLTISICSTVLAGNTQNIVYHADMFNQLMRNETFRTGVHHHYNNTLSGIRDKKEKTTGEISSVLLVQQKIFDALTNVSDGIKNVKTIRYIAEYTGSTFINITTAIQLTAGKPYLIEIAGKQSIIIYERIAELTSFIQTFIMNADEAQLIKPTERDRFLYTVYRQIMVLHSLSADLCDKLRKWRFQDAVYHIIPLNQYYNQDRKLVRTILKEWHF